MQTKLILILAAAAILAIALAGCGSGDGGQPAPTPGPELHFYNWEDFIDPAVLEGFEAEFGIAVIVDTFEDETEAVAVINADTSKYDLFVISDAVIGEMAAQKLLAEIDRDNVPNLANIDSRYLDLPADPGNRFSVPYDWGTTGIVYNATCIEPEAESWAVLRDPRVANRVAMDSDPSVVIGSMLRYLGHSLNSDDPQALDEAVSVITDMRANQGLEFLPWDAMWEQLVAGDLCAAQVFNGDAAYFMAENEDLAFFVPSEGSDFYLDSLAIPRDARNKIGAELFMNYLLRPDVHAAVTNYTGYPNPNRASVEEGHIDAELLADPVIYPDTAGLEPWVVFDSERRALWNEAWAEVQRGGSGVAVR